MNKLVLTLLASIGLMVSCSSKDNKEIVEVVTEKKTPVIVEQPVIIEGPIVAETAKPSIVNKVKEMVAKPQMIAGATSCTAGEDTRIIEITKNDAGCQVNYTKFGASSQVANAANDLSYCDTVANRIQSNLAGAGFACTAQ